MPAVRRRLASYPEATTPLQHALAAELGWGGLPPAHAQYFQTRTTSSGCDTWTFEVPPLDYDHNGYLSAIKYSHSGWLDVERPCLPDSELERNGDGTITVWFGDDRCKGKPNVIEATEGQDFNYAMRLYRPRTETKDHLREVAIPNDSTHLARIDRPTQRLGGFALHCRLIATR